MNKTSTLPGPTLSASEACGSPFKFYKSWSFLDRPPREKRRFTKIANFIFMRLSCLLIWIMNKCLNHRKRELYAVLCVENDEQWKVRALCGETTTHNGQGTVLGITRCLTVSVPKATMAQSVMVFWRVWRLKVPMSLLILKGVRLDWKLCMKPLLYHQHLPSLQETEMIQSCPT